jgi:hypothetical protein
MLKPCKHINKIYSISSKDGLTLLVRIILPRERVIIKNNIYEDL